MATFEYIARTRDGKRIGGTLQADTEAAILRALDERQLFPLSIEAREEVASGVGGGRVTTRQLAMAYSQVADLLTAGVPLMASLQTLARIQKEGGLKAALLKVVDEVSSGKTLADALGEHPGVFRPLHVAMIRAGERGGFLEDVLANLGGFLERQDELRNKVVGTLIYPFILVLVGVGAVSFMLMFLVPRFEQFFSEMTLPLPSRVMFAVSGALRDFWPIVVVAMVMGIAGLISLIKSPWGRKTLDAVVLQLPVVGLALRMLAITRFCRILGTLLSNGVPILQALAISRDAAGLVRLSNAIEEAIENVRKGKSLSDPLRQSGIFPEEILEMITVAEESNQMEKTLLKIAETVDRRTERSVDVAVKLIEPVILVLIAVAIGFVALGILMPVFNMASTLQG
ncbi:MAG: type II secretion system F family protein [Phycisphaeraceae bacterium]|nr:type II secretion system F family protein [Phycisphaeraceae bacterium]